MTLYANRSQADALILALKYPNINQIGGNTGRVNSFVGVDPGDLTGGVFNAQNLLQGNKIACFLFQAVRLAIPAAVVELVQELTIAL